MYVRLKKIYAKENPRLTFVHGTRCVCVCVCVCACVCVLASLSHALLRCELDLDPERSVTEGIPTGSLFLNQCFLTAAARVCREEQ